MSARVARVLCGAWLLACLATGCNGGGKTDIPLGGGQTYKLQSSGKLTVFPTASAQDATGSEPIHRLRVKRKNDNPSAKTEGCWNCTDCICNGDECGCTECTSC
jgi:hypothetical protein